MFDVLGPLKFANKRASSPAKHVLSAQPRLDSLTVAVHSVCVFLCFRQMGPGKLIFT